jgi:hypothetical protein
MIQRKQEDSGPELLLNTTTTTTTTTMAYSGAGGLGAGAGGVFSGNFNGGGPSVSTNGTSNTGAVTATTAPSTRQAHQRIFHGIHTIHHSQFSKQEQKDTNLPQHVKQLIIESSPVRLSGYVSEKVNIRSEQRFSSRDPRNAAVDRSKRRSVCFLSFFHWFGLDSGDGTLPFFSFSFFFGQVLLLMDGW